MADDEVTLPIGTRQATNLVKAMARFLRGVVETLQEFLGESAENPLFRRAFEADLGLPPGSLDGIQSPDANLDQLDGYIDAEDASLVEFLESVDDIHRYINAWRAVLEAAATEDTNRTLDEILYRLFELGTLNYVKYSLPGLYWWARLLGFVEQTFQVHLDESIRLDRLYAFVVDPGPGPYLKGLNRVLRLEDTGDQPPAPCPPDTPPPAPTDDERVILAHTDPGIVTDSDLILGPMMFAPLFVKLIGKLVGLTEYLSFESGKPAGEAIGEAHEFIKARFNGIYGWETTVGSVSPIADLVANRALTLTFASLPDDTDETQTVARAIVGALLVPDPERPGDVAGLYLALRGDLTIDTEVGDPLAPWRIRARMNMPNGFNFLLGDGITALAEPSAALEVAVERAPTTEAAAYAYLPGAAGTRLEFGQLAFALKLSPDLIKFSIRFPNSALVIVSGDADSLLSKILASFLSSEEMRLKFDLGLALDDKRGFYLEGGAGFSATLPIGKSIGPVRIQTVQLNAEPGSGPNGADLNVRVLTSFSVKLKAVTFTIDRIGLKFGLGFSKAETDRPDGTTTLLPAVYIHDDIGFEAPTGIGLLIDAKTVTGGGFLFHDATNNQYAGAIQIQFAKFAFKAIGIISPAPPGSGIPFSLLIVFSFEEFKPLHLFLGVHLTGIGGLIGLNRTADADALRAGLKNRALDAVLFPENPIADAPRLVSSLRAVFPPAADQFLIGPVVKLEWPSVALFKLELGIILEMHWDPGFNLPSFSRVVIVGQLRALLPSPEFAPVKINIDGLGIIDFEHGDLSFDATLYDSSIVAHTLTGDAVGRANGDEGFILALGGFHPRFSPPATLPRQERLAVHFSEGDHLRLRADCYVAVTSNTLQFGVHMEAYVGFGGFSIEGKLGFDALFQGEYPEIIALVHFSVKLKWHGRTLLGASVDMTLEGWKPLHVQGKATFEIFGFDKSKSFNETFFEDEPPPALPPVDPLPDLVAALRDPRSWDAPLPADEVMLVTLRGRPDATEVIVHPLAEIGVRQRVVPLNVEIGRFGPTRPSGDRRFVLTDVSLDNVPAVVEPAFERFAPAQFLDLSDNEKLARPSFERMEAGLSLPTSRLAYGGQAAGTTDFMASTTLDYETCILGANGKCIPESRPSTLDPGRLLEFAELGPAARSALRVGGGRYDTPTPEPRPTVAPTTFAVAGVADLRPVAVEPGARANAYPSYTAAQQAIQHHLLAHPEDALRLQVVWGHELAEADV